MSLDLHGMDVAQSLVSKHVLTDSELEKVKNSSASKRNDLLLALVDAKCKPGSEVWPIFCDCVEELQPAMKHVPSGGWVFSAFIHNVLFK